MFANASNRLSHEKKANHLPKKNRANKVIPNSKSGIKIVTLNSAKNAMILCFLYVTTLDEFVKMLISFQDFFLFPCSKFLFVKTPINLKTCLSQWIRCYNLSGSIFYLQDSARKQIKQLLLIRSLLGKCYFSLLYNIDKV